jgi:hypothetical protein
VLQWAREQGCPWNELTSHYAAKGGHLAVLQWAWEQGCPLDEETCLLSAKSGHLAVLQWAMDETNGMPFDIVDMCDAALQVRLTDARAKASCLHIHAEASLSIHLSLVPAFRLQIQRMSHHNLWVAPNKHTKKSSTNEAQLKRSSLQGGNADVISFLGEVGRCRLTPY